MQPKQYGRVLYLDLSTSGSSTFETTTLFPFEESKSYRGNVNLQTKHLVGFSNNPANQLNGLPVVHVFPANVATANVPPSLQRTQGGGGLAIPYESGQNDFIKAFIKDPQSYQDMGITNPEIAVIGFPTVSYEPGINLNNQKHAEAVFNHFLAGMYFQLARGNLCIPVNDQILCIPNGPNGRHYDALELPNRNNFPTLTFPVDRRAAFGGGVDKVFFLPIYGAWFHEQLFIMDSFANALAAAQSCEDQDNLIAALNPQFKDAFNKGSVQAMAEFYGPFDAAQLKPKKAPSPPVDEIIFIENLNSNILLQGSSQSDFFAPPSEQTPLNQPSPKVNVEEKEVDHEKESFCDKIVRCFSRSNK